MYLSKSTEAEEVNSAYLAEMAGIATIRNQEIGVSGFLMYSDPFFFQVCSSVLSCDVCLVPMCLYSSARAYRFAKLKFRSIQGHRRDRRRPRFPLCQDRSGSSSRKVCFSARRLRESFAMPVISCLWGTSLSASKTPFDFFSSFVPHRCIVLANGPCSGRLYGDWHMKDSHIDSITSHPAMKTILYQIARSFSSMWSYLPKSAGHMLLLGKVC